MKHVCNVYTYMGDFERALGISLGGREGEREREREELGDLIQRIDRGERV